jgi:crotonobetainyl-CoA:carnitine CoA-transferase CaiB-like acyl-CoA transferase
MAGPLEGLRVIELAHIMAGPVCGMMLADLGADVMKVERIPGGDDTRRMVPPLMHGESAAYLMMNRNKRGLALDLKSEGGRAVLRRLIETSDVLIENYRKGTLDRLGFGWDVVHALNPRLVYAEISGFGRTGPLADAGGFDLIAQGMSGLMSITGEGGNRPPVKVGAPVTDTTAGMLAALGITAALHHAQRTGEGQKVDTSLFEAGITHTYWQSAIQLATGESPGPLGSAHPLNAPYEAFETTDGHINVGAANQANWLRLVKAIGAPQLADDPRFARNADRMANHGVLSETLNAIFATKSTEAWLAALSAADVPAGAVLSIGEMLEHPQTLAREMVVDTGRDGIKAIGLPIKLSATPGDIRRPAPTMGEHTREILGELGFDAEAIEAMFVDQAVA